MADKRSYTGGRFSLDIDGFNVGYLKKFSGMSMEGDIAEHKLGPDNVVKKHLANMKWTPGKASFGIGMGLGMYQWMKQSFDKSYVPKNGTLRAGDFNNKCQAMMTFHAGIITSITV